MRGYMISVVVSELSFVDLYGGCAEPQCSATAFCADCGLLTLSFSRIVLFQNQENESPKTTNELSLDSESEK